MRRRRGRPRRVRTDGDALAFHPRLPRPRQQRRRPRGAVADRPGRARRRAGRHGRAVFAVRRERARRCRPAPGAVPQRGLRTAHDVATRRTARVVQATRARRRPRAARAAESPAAARPRSHRVGRSGDRHPRSRRCRTRSGGIASSSPGRCASSAPIRPVGRARNGRGSCTRPPSSPPAVRRGSPATAASASCRRWARCTTGT